MNVDEMPAGVELDVLMAEALGYVRTPIIIEAEGIAIETEGPIFIVVKGVSLVGDDRVYIRQTISGKFTRFAPSTDIAAAWEVIIQVEARFSVDTSLTTGQFWYAKFEDRGDGTWQDEVVVQASAPTAPLAICRAALKFVEARGDQVMSIDEMLSWA